MAWRLRPHLLGKHANQEIAIVSWCTVNPCICPHGNAVQIAKGYGIDWTNITALNDQIEDPNLIYEGDVIRLPCPGAACRRFWPRMEARTWVLLHGLSGGYIAASGCSLRPFLCLLPLLSGCGTAVPYADLESEGSIAELLEHRSDTYYAFTAIVKAGLLEDLSSERGPGTRAHGRGHVAGPGRRHKGYLQPGRAWCRLT